MPPTVTVRRAIWRGHLVVNGPVVLLLALPFALLFALRDAWTPALLPVGFVAAWVYWSWSLPRWRLWAYEHVDSIPLLVSAAISAGLMWPPGHPAMRTEITTRALRARERAALRRRGVDATGRPTPAAERPDRARRRQFGDPAARPRAASREQQHRRDQQVEWRAVALMLVVVAVLILGPGLLPGNTPPLALYLGVFGAGVAVAAAWFAVRRRAVRHWKAVPCRVVIAEVDVQPPRGRSTRYTGGRSHTAYVPRVSYTYEVDGVHYTGDRLTVEPRRFLTMAAAESVLEPFIEGAPATCHYDPRRPAQSVLDLTPSGTSPVVLFAFAALLFGAALVAGLLQG